MSARLGIAILATTMLLHGEAVLVEGKPDSSVRVMIYEDLQCPDCADFRRMLDERILPRYATRVAFIHHDFPLAKHAWARKAAIAGRHFAEISPDVGLAWRRYIMGAIVETTPENFNHRLTEFAQAHDADSQAAVASLDDARLAGMVEKDFEDGVARGVAKTPTVVVGGNSFVEHFSFEEISRAIDKALVQHQAGQARGLPHAL